MKRNGSEKDETRYTGLSSLPWWFLITLCCKYFNVCFFASLKIWTNKLTKLDLCLQKKKSNKTPEIAQSLWSHVANKPGTTFFLDYVLLSLKICMTALCNVRMHVRCHCLQKGCEVVAGCWSNLTWSCIVSSPLSKPERK